MKRKTQSDQNIHQNAPNCIILSKFSRTPEPLSIYMHANIKIPFSIQIISKYTSKRINCKCFQKNFSRELPHSKRVSKILISFIKMSIFNFFI